MTRQPPLDITYPHPPALFERERIVSTDLATGAVTVHCATWADMRRDVAVLQVRELVLVALELGGVVVGVVDGD